MSEKPVPQFLQDLDILNLHECEITLQQISVKGEDGSEELLAVSKGWCRCSFE